MWYKCLYNLKLTFISHNAHWYPFNIVHLVFVSQCTLRMALDLRASNNPLNDARYNVIADECNLSLETNGWIDLMPKGYKQLWGQEGQNKQFHNSCHQYVPPARCTKQLLNVNFMVNFYLMPNFHINQPKCKWNSNMFRTFLMHLSMVFYLWKEGSLFCIVVMRSTKLGCFKCSWCLWKALN
jgi:hypothetical protein